MSEQVHRLRSDIVTSLDAAAQSFGFVGPVFVMAFLTTFVAIGAGLATPLAALLSGLASIAVGYVVAQFAIRHRAAGSIYTYIAQTFGPIQGFMGGWIYMFAVLMLTMAIIAGVAGWTSGFLADFAGINIHWLVILAVELIVLFLLTYFDVRYSTRLQLTIVAISVVIVLALALTIIITGGAEGNTLAPFNPSSAGSLGGLAFGLIFGMLLYTGYESAAVLAEESQDAKRAIPLAVIGSATLATVFYAIVTYAFAIGFGPSGVSAWAEDPAVLFTMGAMYWGEWAVPLMFAIAIIDAFAVSMATVNTVARVFYAMGRDGALPRALGRTQPTYQTPHVANGVTLVLGLLFALAFIPIGGLAGSWELEFGFLAGMGAIAVEVIYIYVAVAGIIYFRQVMGSEYSVFKHLIVPIIAVIGPAAALYGSVLPQGGIMNAMPYIVLAWVVLGIALISYLRSSQPDMVAKLGADLGVEEMGEMGAEAPAAG